MIPAIPGSVPSVSISSSHNPLLSSEVNRQNIPLESRNDVIANYSRLPGESIKLQHWPAHEPKERSSFLQSTPFGHQELPALHVFRSTILQLNRVMIILFPQYWSWSAFGGNTYSLASVQRAAHASRQGLTT